MLNFETYGDGGKTLMIAHGLFGSGRNWRAIARRLSSSFRVVTVDMRNHAGSFWHDEMSYRAMASDLAEVLESLGGRAIVLGHSMGGKATMALALTRPDLVERMIIADIAPVAYTHSQTQFIDAMEAVDLTKVEKRSDADAQLALGIGDPLLRAFLLQSLDVSDGAAKWVLNLQVLRATMPEIVGWQEVAGRYDGPSLFVSGSESDYLTADGKRKVKSQFGAARFASLKGAGHWLHADQPRAFIETVQAYCAA